MLVDTLRNDLWYLVQPANVNNLFCCFLDPSTMEQEASIAPENESVQSLFPDPIYQLFNLDVRQEGENHLFSCSVNVFRLHVIN